MPPSRLGQAGRRTLVPGNGPLSKVPPLAVFGLVLVIFVAAILVRGVIGAVLLGVLGLGLIGLLAGTWRVLRPADRFLRIVVILILVMADIRMVR